MFVPWCFLGDPFSFLYNMWLAIGTGTNFYRRVAPLKGFLFCLDGCGESVTQYSTRYLLRPKVGRETERYSTTDYSLPVPYRPRFAICNEKYYLNTNNHIVGLITKYLFQ